MDAVFFVSSINANAAFKTALIWFTPQPLSLTLCLALTSKH